jgi:ribosomal protein L11 methyltransferase
MSAGDVWRTTIEVEEGAVEPFWTALEAAGESVAVVRAASGLMRVEAFGETEPDRAAVEVALALAAASLGMACAPTPSYERLGPRDWLAESRASFPPLALGRFVVHAVEAPPALAHGAIGLAMDAGMAFGSGRHASTQLCLDALARLAARRVRPRRALDLGCGSAILAIAMAKLWPLRVLGSDSDASVLPIAEENARQNGVAPRFGVVRARGFAQARVRAGAPYDLVAANILFRPLRALAPAFARAVRPGGHVVLSGLLLREERRILGRYRRAGFEPILRVKRADWLGLLLRRR